MLPRRPRPSTMRFCQALRTWASSSSHSSVTQSTLFPLAKELDSSVASEECSARPEGWPRAGLVPPSASRTTHLHSPPLPLTHSTSLPQSTPVPSPQIAPPRIQTMHQLNLGRGDHRTAEWEWGPFYFGKGLLTAVRLA